MNRGVWWAKVHGVTESDMTERLSTAQYVYKGFPGGASGKRTHLPMQEICV